MKFLKTFLIVFLIGLTSASAAELQAKFQDWSIFKTNRVDRMVCYVISTPIKRSGYAKERGESFLMVTNVENDADEINVSSGFDYDEKKDVELSFGDKKYYLFPHVARAWANNKNDDIEIIKQMQRNADLVVSANNVDGKIFHDRYSLIGFAQAYLKMKNICKD